MTAAGPTEIAGGPLIERSPAAPLPVALAGQVVIGGLPLDQAARSALLPEVSDKTAPSGLAVWRNSSSERMRRRAAALGTPLITLGAGLLRAPPQYGRAAAGLSVTAVAVEGPRSPADMLSPDRVLARRDWETPQLLDRAAALRRDLASWRVGGAWWGEHRLPGGDGIALVEGETAAAPLAEPVWRAMLGAALADNPAGKIVILTGGGRGRSQALARAARRHGCRVVAGPVDPWAAVALAARIYTAGGETGFIGLLAGREVRCFGVAFYSGWGITQDDPCVMQRPFRRGLDEIVAGACLVATRCRDPFRRRPAPFEDVAALLADWRRTEAANRGIAVCVGMSFWKRRRVAAFFRSAEGGPLFRRTTRGAVAAARAAHGAVAVWASRAPSGLVAAAEREHIRVVRVEDGFLRSVGLGSNFVPAASLVLDSRGMHYDPDVCTDLQVLLRDTQFDKRILARARTLTARLVARGITKYNLAAAPLPSDLPRGRRLILVPGQVEDDLSVLFNRGDIRGNLDLLRRVRAANPDADILYKPHPDVDAGHRIGAVPDAVIKEVADAVVRSVSMAALLDEIDEVHTLTSLAGFEALLRGRKVVAYGRPFYAGWGLTTDMAPIDRGRRLSLEELVAGALILYPRYLDPVTRLPCPPEIVVERLDDPELWRPGPLVLGRRAQGLAVRQWRGLIGRLAKPNAERR
jgi:capsular polysaccharide export protein